VLKRHQFLKVDRGETMRADFRVRKLKLTNSTERKKEREREELQWNGQSKSSVFWTKI